MKDVPSMKSILNILLVLLLIGFLFFGWQADVYAKSVMHQIYASMQVIKALCVGIILAIINR